MIRRKPLVSPMSVHWLETGAVVSSRRKAMGLSIGGKIGRGLARIA
jgi:hypothetical protein